MEAITLDRYNELIRKEHTLEIIVEAVKNRPDNKIAEIVHLLLDDKREGEKCVCI